LSHGTHVSFYEYQRATQGVFERADPGGQTIVVDAFPANDPLYPRAGKYVYERRYKDSGAKLLEPTKDEGFGAKLAKEAKASGPIGKLDYFGHGWPGTLLIDEKGDIQIDPRPFLEAGFVPDAMGRFHGVFKPGAVVRFNACFVGNGCKGREFVELFERTFLPDGGVVILSELQMVANPVEYAALAVDAPEPPEWLRALAEPARTPLALWTAFEVAAWPKQGMLEWPVKDRIVVHVVPPAATWRDEKFEARIGEVVTELAKLRDERDRSPARMKKRLDPVLDWKIPGMGQVKDLAPWDTSLKTWEWAYVAPLERSKAEALAKALEPWAPFGIRAKPWPIGAAESGIVVEYAPKPDFSERVLAAKQRLDALERELEKNPPPKTPEDERRARQYRQRLEELKRFYAYDVAR
jgi:hypothetical protein